MANTHVFHVIRYGNIVTERAASGSGEAQQHGQPGGHLASPLHVLHLLHSHAQPANSALF